jgi:hypothetical protein
MRDYTLPTCSAKSEGANATNDKYAALAEGAAAGTLLPAEFVAYKRLTSAAKSDGGRVGGLAAIANNGHHMGSGGRAGGPAGGRVGGKVKGKGGTGKKRGNTITFSETSKG